MDTKERIIVSFTTYPARIGFVPTIYENMMAQTVKPDLLVLWLSRDQFPGEMADLPEDVKALTKDDAFLVRFVDEDLKPHKKYFYALQEFPEDAIITIDDDLVFDNDLIASLVAGHRAYPRALCVARTHVMMVDNEGALLPYVNWLVETDLYLNRPSFQAFATTGAGTLVPPHVFGPMLFDKSAIYDTCLFADDIWIKANSLFYEIPTVLVKPNHPLTYIEGSQAESLYASNSKGGNDQQFLLVRNYISKSTSVDIIKDKLVPKLDFGPECNDLLSNICSQYRSLVVEINKREHRLDNTKKELGNKISLLQDELGIVKTELSSTTKELNITKSNLEKKNQELINTKDYLAKKNQELKAVYESKAYKVGTALASPIRKIRGK